jgi:hypothetical protein
LTKAQLALAQAEAELAEAEAASKKEEFSTHSQEREHHLKQRHSIFVINALFVSHDLTCVGRGGKADIYQDRNKMVYWTK